MPIFIVFAAVAGLGIGLTISSSFLAPSGDRAEAHAAGQVALAAPARAAATGLPAGESASKGKAEASAPKTPIQQSAAPAATSTKPDGGRPVIVTRREVAKPDVSAEDATSRPFVDAASILAKTMGADTAPDADEDTSDIPVMALAEERGEERAMPDVSSKPDEMRTAGVAMPKPVEPAAAAEPQVPAGAEASRTARIRTAVNLRSSPSNRGRVLKVVPANSSVGVVDCDSWCEIIAGGTRGYVFKSFVNGSGSSAAKRVSAKPQEKRKQSRDAATPAAKAEAAPPPSEPATAPAFSVRP